MNSGPIVAMVWEGANAVKLGRGMVLCFLSSILLPSTLTSSSPPWRNQPCRLGSRHHPWWYVFWLFLLPLCSRWGHAATSPAILLFHPSFAPFLLCLLPKLITKPQANFLYKTSASRPAATFATDPTRSRMPRRKLLCGSRRRSSLAGASPRRAGSTSKFDSVQSTASITGEGFWLVASLSIPCLFLEENRQTKRAHSNQATHPGLAG